LRPVDAFLIDARLIVVPKEIWNAWTFEPVTVGLLVVSLGLYAIGVARVWSAATPGAGARTWRVVCFALGWIALALALVSPLHALGGMLFSAHMTQHEILISVAAPLLVLGKPLIPFVWAFPPDGRKRLARLSHARIVASVWRVLTAPAVAFALHAIALWGWHLPGPYQATLTSELAHSLQHTSFILTALLFWWTVLGPAGGELSRGKSILYLFATALHTGALGALLTFSASLWYPAYATTTAPWGLTPLEDQQLGGLIMWIPGSFAYLVATLGIFALWMGETERRSAYFVKARRLTPT
jgi:cytochrome c oxidase assembly factor CtaG